MKFTEQPLRCRVEPPSAYSSGSSGDELDIRLCNADAAAHDLSGAPLLWQDLVTPTSADDMDRLLSIDLLCGGGGGSCGGGGASGATAPAQVSTEAAALQDSSDFSLTDALGCEPQNLLSCSEADLLLPFSLEEIGLLADRGSAGPASPAEPLPPLLQPPQCVSALAHMLAAASEKLCSTPRQPAAESLPAPFSSGKPESSACAAASSVDAADRPQIGSTPQVFGGCAPGARAASSGRPLRKGNKRGASSALAAQPEAQEQLATLSWLHQRKQEQNRRNQADCRARKKVQTSCAVVLPFTSSTKVTCAAQVQRT